MAGCSLFEGLHIGKGTSLGGVLETPMDEEVMCEPEDGVYAVTRVGRGRWHWFAACGARSCDGLYVCIVSEGEFCLHGTTPLRALGCFAL